jgi:hypothetical protein
MVELELANQKRKLNAPENQKSKRWKLNVEARVLTSMEGRQMAIEKDTERMAKEKKKSDSTALRKEKENLRQQQ